MPKKREINIGKASHFFTIDLKRNNNALIRPCQYRSGIEAIQWKSLYRALSGGRGAREAANYRFCWLIPRPVGKSRVQSQILVTCKSRLASVKREAASRMAKNNELFCSPPPPLPLSPIAARNTGDYSVPLLSPPTYPLCLFSANKARIHFIYKIA